MNQAHKSSRLIIKPKEFKSSLLLRRSQEEIKTQRVDSDDESMGLESIKLPAPGKIKSDSEI